MDGSVCMWLWSWRWGGGCGGGGGIRVPMFQPVSVGLCILVLWKPVVSPRFDRLDVRLYAPREPYFGRMLICRSPRSSEKLNFEPLGDTSESQNTARGSTGYFFVTVACIPHLRQQRLFSNKTCLFSDSRSLNYPAEGYCGRTNRAPSAENPQLLKFPSS